MKFLILLTTVLTIFSCGEKAWEGCDGAEYTASVEESETIFKAESSLYDGFHCPVMEDAWPGTDSKALVDYFIGTYTMQKAFVDDYGHEKILLDDALFDEESNLWKEFTINSLVSCQVGVARSGDDCEDLFSLAFESNKCPIFILPSGSFDYQKFYSGWVTENGADLGGSSLTQFSGLNDTDSLQIGLSFEVKDRDYERIILLYSKD